MHENFRSKKFRLTSPEKAEACIAVLRLGHLGHGAYLLGAQFHARAIESELRLVPPLLQLPQAAGELKYAGMFLLAKWANFGIKMGIR